jgi:hypothetical protein
METGDAAAVAQGCGLASARWEPRGVVARTGGLLPDFRDLLRRRGYFVESAPEFALSLDEGIHLFDLAGQLAALDTVLTPCLKAFPRPLFPGLDPFAPPCPGGRHPLKPHG